MNEKAFGKGLIARGKHWLVFGKKTKTSPTLKARERLLANQVLISNWLFFSDLDGVTQAQWMQQYTNNVSYRVN